MEEILYLEPDEEITSVIDKLKGLPGDDVALVLPKRSGLAASVVNLKLLKREATRLKKRIALITQDRVGTSLAGQVGIPVYRSVGDDEPVAVARETLPKDDDTLEIDATPKKQEAETTDEEAGIPVHRYDASAKPNGEVRDAIYESNSPLVTSHNSQLTTHKAVEHHIAEQPRNEEVSVQSKLKRPSGPLLRRGPMLALVAVILMAAAGWFFFLYPQATVLLSVSSEPISQSATVTVDNNINEVQAEQGKIPGQKVQVETTVKANFPATGSKEVGTKATGTVVVSNRLGETVSLPKGSSLLREDRSFVTTEAIEIGAATVSLDSAGNVIVKPGTKTVAVEANTVGSAFNLGAGDFVITSFTGTKRDRVSAANTSAFTGGESRTVKVVTEEDISKAKETVGTSKSEELTKQLNEQAKDITVLANTIQVEVLEANSSKSVGDEADTFDIEAKIRARTIGFVAKDYQEAIVSTVSKTLPEGKELIVSSQDSVETKVKNSNFDQGMLELEGILRASIVQRIDEGALRNLIRGKTTVVASELLKAQEGIQDAQIQLRPVLRSTIPKSDSQISFQVNQQ